MTDRFGKELEIGDFVAWVTRGANWKSEHLYRIIGFNEEKDIVYIMWFDRPDRWDKEQGETDPTDELWEELCKDPVRSVSADWRNAKVYSYSLVKTYRPYWMPYKKSTKKTK